MPSGEYYVRGGICWPVEIVESNGDIYAEGFALLAGQNVRTKVIYVLTGTSFRCIDHVVHESRIRYHGLAPWLNMIWSSYYATHFFFRGEQVAHLAYLKQIRDSQLISPKPHFIEVAWKDDGLPMAQIWELLQTDRLKYQPMSNIAQELQKQKRDNMPVGVRALMACVSGYQKYPWRSE